MINNEKEYSEIKAAYGEDTLKKIENRALELRAGGYERSTRITDPAKQSSMEEKLCHIYGDISLHHYINKSGQKQIVLLKENLFEGSN